jgi:hypothetical protein
MGYDIKLVEYSPTRDRGYIMLEKIGDEYQVHISYFIDRWKLEKLMDYDMNYPHHVKRIFSSRSKSKSLEVYRQKANQLKVSPYETRIIHDRADKLFK